MFFMFLILNKKITQQCVQYCVLKMARAERNRPKEDSKRQQGEEERGFFFSCCQASHKENKRGSAAPLWTELKERFRVKITSEVILHCSLSLYISSLADPLTFGNSLSVCFTLQYELQRFTHASSFFICVIGGRLPQMPGL